MSTYDNEPDLPEKRRVIRYLDLDDDIENGKGPSPNANQLKRRASAASMASEHSELSARVDRIRRQQSFDVNLTVPIEYRTLSIHIEDTKEKNLAEATKINNKAASELAGLDWHLISCDTLYERLGTSGSHGLSQEQATANLITHGRNVPSAPPSHLPRKIFGYFFGGFGSLLLVGSILVFISWRPLGDPPSTANLALAIVLMAVFFIQAFFNAWQDFSSSRVMDSITGMLPESCNVIRGGDEVHIPAQDIVPGDLLLLKAGMKIPADVRMIEVSSDAKFDRAILTGESLPLSGSTVSTDDNYLETRCIGMQGTHCVSGSASGIVVSTGDQTVFGKIAKLTSQPDTKMTPLQKEILNFVIIICSLMLMFIVIVVAVWAGYLRKNQPGWISVPNLIVSVVSIGISFVPEGLPIALTASLTIVANTMKKNNVLCKSLKTVETLGAVSVICSDKTGTLTKNHMTVTDCFIGSEEMNPAVARETIEDTKAALRPAVKQMRSLAGLCNAASFDVTTLNKPLAERIINGDATDQAVLRFSESLGPVGETRSLWHKRFEIAFNSKNKFMIRMFTLAEPQGIDDALATNDPLGADDMLLTIKGAPDVLIPRCTSVVSSTGLVTPLTPSFLIQLESIKDGWSSKGKRVILLARKVLPSSDIKSATTDGAFEDECMEYARGGLTLVGLVGIVDPPREEIPEVVKTLRGAGIRIFMVTGDFKLTAQAIAMDCGIVTNPPHLTDSVSALIRFSKASASTSIDLDNNTGNKPAPHDDLTERPSVKSLVLSGPELVTLNDYQWDQLCQYDEIVFARTTPEQKLRIVNEFQRHHNLVAMTGDGVNDAPSLKAADIGIALGTGSDIAIAASDMVLLDSFAGVVQAVLYGRIVFDNLKKTIAYLLPAGTFSEFWPVFTNVTLGLPQILSSFLMIVICCLTDCAAATTLAYEKPEADVMSRPPRRPKRDKLVDWKLLMHAYLFVGGIECVTSFAVAYWHLQRNGLPFSALWLGYGVYPPSITPERATKLLSESSSIYFVNLVIMQMFNVLATRTRRLSIVSHPPTRNWLILPAVLFALGMVFLFCYVPGLQRVIGSEKVAVEYFFLPVAFGAAVLGLDEARKAAVRRWPKGLLARCAW